MTKRIGIIGIVISDRERSAFRVNEILSAYGRLIVARTGLPFHDQGISVMSLIIEASTDELGSLTGKLGMLEGVRVKSLMV